MNLLTDEWETERCVLLGARKQNLAAMVSIFAENGDAIGSQGPDCQPERLALALLNHESLPPNGEPSQERTLIIADKATHATIGLLSLYCGFPTNRALYIGSLFFRRDWQRQRLGQEIVEDLERRALQNGYDVAHVAVGIRNWPAIRFWVAVGFDRIVRIVGDKSFGETAYADVELAKTLKQTDKPLR